MSGTKLTNSEQFYKTFLQRSIMLDFRRKFNKHLFIRHSHGAWTFLAVIKEQVVGESLHRPVSYEINRNNK